MHSFKLLAIFTLSAWLSGCGSMETILDVPKLSGSAVVKEYDVSLFSNSIHLFTPVAVGTRVDELKLQRRIENLIVLIDPGSSSSAYRGIPQEVYQREVFRRFNRSIPRLALNGGVWRVGGDSPPSKLGSYQTQQIEKNLDSGNSLPLIGDETLVGSINIATDLASAMRGRTALLLVTNWGNISKDVEDAVARFYQRGETEVGFRIIPGVEEWQGSVSPYCFYAIGTGDSMSRSTLEKLDRCGMSVASDRVMQPRDMAHFVETLLFMGPADTDADGVYDYKDKCPDTPADRLIDFDGCLRFPTGSARG